MDPTERTARTRTNPLDAVEARAQPIIIGSVRIVAGLLWLANLEWKRPGDFGLLKRNGLYKYVDSAVRRPVFPPYSWFLEHVVLKQYRAFGWISLLTEATLAVLLLTGFFTRAAALVGAAMSVTIAMAVLTYDKSYEWPWSYYLMFVLHLLLFAVGAGRYFGIDGVRRRGQAAARNAHVVLGVVGVVVGLFGLIFARSLDFAAKQGALFGWKFGELKILWFNPLSALLTIAFGAALAVGAVLRQKVVVLAGTAGFAVLAVLVIFLWRDGAQGWTGGFLGATGATMAFWAALAVGSIGVLTISTRDQTVK